MNFFSVLLFIALIVSTLAGLVPDNIKDAAGGAMGAVKSTADGFMKDPVGGAFSTVGGAQKEATDFLGGAGQTAGGAAKSLQSEATGLF